MLPLLLFTLGARRTCMRRPSARCRKSGWPKQRRMPSWPWTPSPRATAQIRRSRRLPDEGLRRANRILRLSCGTLEALANYKSNRKHLRDCAAQDDPIERLPLKQDRACDGVQAGRGRPEKLASARPNHLSKLIQGVKFTDGTEAVRQDAQTAAA